MLEPSRLKLADQPLLPKWRQTFKELGAEWEYNGGDVCALHTLSGKVSDYYFNSEVISNNTEILSALCREVYLPEIERRNITVDLVASYAPYGVAFANELARALGVGSCFLRSLAAAAFDQDLKIGSRILVVAASHLVAPSAESGGTSSYTPEEISNYEKYGYRYMYDQFYPHLTLGRLNREPTPHEIERVTAIARKLDLFTPCPVSALSTYEMGSNGAHARAIMVEHLAPVV